MEQFLNSLPKSVLVFAVLLIGVLAAFMLSPPHTVCDTYTESFKDRLAGVIYPSKVNKKSFPAKILKAKESCTVGVSSGSCYEYFSILKLVAKDIMNAPQECASSLYEISEVQKTLIEGTEKMALMAWGDLPPEPGSTRFSWLQESELALFCLLRDTYVRSFGGEQWTEFRRKVFNKFPAEPLVIEKDPSKSGQPRMMATTKFSENEIWSRSIFSIRCENYK